MAKPELRDWMFCHLPFWAFPEWWRYIFAPITRVQRVEDSWWWVRIPLCRWRGHPYPVTWYNPNGLEPDMHCTNCYDDLG